MFYQERQITYDILTKNLYISDEHHLKPSQSLLHLNSLNNIQF